MPPLQIPLEERVQLISFVVVAVAVIAIFFTTASGRRIAQNIGFRPGMMDPAPKKDREFLLRVCDGDGDTVAAMLAEARRNRPAMSELEAYRAAIRVHLRENG